MYVAAVTDAARLLWCRPQLEECPICFMGYPMLNTSICCLQRVCTECFLQVRPSRCFLIRLCCIARYLLNLRYYC